MADAPRLLIATSVPSTLTAFLLPYAAHYRARGWWVGAAANGAASDPRVVAAFDAAFELPWTRRPSDPVNLTGAVTALQRLVARERVDLVHVHDPVAAFVARLALRRARRRGEVKVAYTAHGFHFFEGNAPHRNLIFRTLETVAAPWTDELIVINQEDLRAARRLPVAGAVTYLAGIGVDTAKYDPAAVGDADVARVRSELGLTAAQQLLLMVAALNPGKRHRDAVAALAAADRPHVVLACAGEGPEAAAITEQARALGVGERVKLLGYRRDVPALLRASFALTLPSEREGLPRCLMEASCLERPVLATRIRGVEELVQDGVTGLLTDVGDVAAQAEAIRRLVDDPDASAAMGIAGRVAMRRFDLGAVLEAHDAVYQRLLGPRFT
jgi:glycosyltransferase involved in cell wall biosynthesis